VSAFAKLETKVKLPMARIASRTKVIVLLILSTPISLKKNNVKAE
jgi:hypothetical protein